MYLCVPQYVQNTSNNKVNGGKKGNKKKPNKNHIDIGRQTKVVEIWYFNFDRIWNLF